MQFYDYDLLDLPVFKGLSKEQIQQLLNFSGANLKRYSSGQSIQLMHETATDLGLILEGRAIALCEDRLGNEAVSCALSFGDIVGTSCMNQKDRSHFVSIECSTDVVVLHIPYVKMVQFGNHQPTVLNIIYCNIISELTSRNSRLMEKVNVVCQRTLRERIIVYLQQLQRHQKSRQVNVPGRVLMSKKMCCHRSALTRELSAMRDEGILDFGTGWMILLNVDSVK